ncbi:MAG: hypothetical protein PHQ23_03275 [Candidatus Wallbacteria bacterium]|nr:hypothetical protein [Candidatus Wallbacteria bacterium]
MRSFLPLIFFICLECLLPAADITATLDSDTGASGFVIRDSGNAEVGRLDSDGNAVFKGGLRLDSAGIKCATTEMMIVDGRIGIGTDNPAYPLTVNGIARASQVLVGATNEALITYYAAGQDLILSPSKADWDDSVRIGPDHQWFFSSGNIVMSVSNGKVGINNSSPSSSLDVIGTAEIVNGLFVDTDLFYANGALGKVGIGTSTPQTLLQVDERITVLEGARYWSLGCGRADGGGNGYPDAAATSNGTFAIRDVWYQKDRIRIESNGNVLTPGQTAFEAKLSSAISPGGYIIWDVVVTNTGGCYNNANGLFTAPVAGMYLFGFNLLVASTATGEFRFALYKNHGHNNCWITYKTVAVWQTSEGTQLIYLDAGDTVGIYYQSGSGATHTDANYDRFWGFLMG